MSPVMTRTPGVKSTPTMETRLRRRQRLERTAKLDQFFTHKRAKNIIDIYHRRGGPERVLAIRTPHRKIRIRVSNQVMTAVFPAWPSIVKQRQFSRPCEIENVSFKEPEAEFALKLLICAAHGESHIIKGLETATAKQLFYVGEMWMWLGEPNWATQFMQPVDLRDAVDKGIENLFWEAGGLNYIDGWPLLGIVVNRFHLEELAWFLSNTMIFSFNKDGNIVINEPIESLTQEQLVAVTNTWPKSKSRGSTH